MKFHKGKTVFNFKDTFSMNFTLSKVILAGLLKYKEVINAEEGRKGIPASISQELIEQGVVEYQEDYQLSDEDWDKCSDYFDYVLDEMIHAFDSSNEPDIRAYNFKHTFVKNSVQDSIGISGNMECSNEEAKDSYNEDMKAYRKRCDEGRMFFAVHFESLWW